MKTIVVAIDFSEITTRLIEKAAEMAACLAAHVYIIHVASPDPDFVGYEVGPAYIRQSRAGELKQEKKELERLARTLKGLGVEATPLLIQGPTADLILQETRRLKAELLIIATHGHRFSLGALLGSTSQQVMRNATCPVLVIPCRNAVPA